MLLTPRGKHIGRCPFGLFHSPPGPTLYTQLEKKIGESPRAVPSLGVGFPSMMFCAEERGWIVLAMDFLGPSLEDLLNFCQRKFSKKTVLMLIDQAISRIQSLHDRSLIHRDVRRRAFARLSLIFRFSVCFPVKTGKFPHGHRQNRESPSLDRFWPL